MDDQARLESIYDTHAAQVYAYAVRHVGRDQADDVLSETFAVAWRRIDVMPHPALPWLLVTAGNVIRNQRRSEARRIRLGVAVAGLYPQQGDGVDVLVAERDHLLAALDQLSDTEREALLLVAWDGLSTRDAAQVARCGVRAFRARLTRARARLSAELDIDRVVPVHEEVHP